VEVFNPTRVRLKPPGPHPSAAVELQPHEGTSETADIVAGGDPNELQPHEGTSETFGAEGGL